MRKLLFAIGFALSAFASIYAKSGQLDINVVAPQLKNSEICLGQYLMGKLYSKDTIKIDDKGRGRLQADEKYPEGMYVFYLSSSKYFDVLIGDNQEFTLVVDTVDLPLNIKIKGDGQTPAFFDYTLRLMDKQRKAKELVEKEKACTDSVEIEKIRAEINLLNEALKADRAAIIERFGNSMTSLFLQGLQVPEYKENEAYEGLPQHERDSLSMLDRYMFYSRHYLDNFDFADPRTYRTPYCMNSVDTYLNKILLQVYDSIVPRALELVESSRASDECFRYMCSHILGYSLQSKVMGMDSLFVAMADNYYLNGTATWADSTLVENIRKEADKVRRCLVGKPGHNLVVKDVKDNRTSLYDSAGEKFTVLFFYEPTCGHCKTTTPQLVEFYEKYKDDPRIKIVAFYMLTDKDEWVEFIEKNKMQNLTNVWDPDRESFYWYWYDTSTTPQIYVLDKDNNIFVKRIDVKTLETIAEHEL